MTEGSDQPTFKDLEILMTKIIEKFVDEGIDSARIAALLIRSGLRIMKMKGVTCEQTVAEIPRIWGKV